MNWLKNFLRNWLEIPSSVDETFLITKSDLREEIAAALNYILSEGPYLSNSYDRYITQKERMEYCHNLHRLAANQLDIMFTERVNKESFLDDIITRIKAKQL